MSTTTTQQRYIRITVHVPPPVYQQLQEQAKAERRSLAAHAGLILQQHVDDDQRPRQDNDR